MMCRNFFYNQVIFIEYTYMKHVLLKGESNSMQVKKQLQRLREERGYSQTSMDDLQDDQKQYVYHLYYLENTQAKI